MRALWREPLVHFLVIGMGLFALDTVAGDRSDPQTRRIVVTASDIQALRATFTSTWLQPPTETQLAALIEQHVRDEVFYREALAGGLDRNDSAIRRRLLVRMDQLAQDSSTLVEPTEADLKAFLAEHPALFRRDATVDFTQVFVSRDRRGDRAHQDALATLTQLRGAGSRAAEGRGDPTSLPARITGESHRRVAALFGEPFAQSISRLPVGEWGGPVASPFGYHLVYVTSRQAESLPPLSTIRGDVAREWSVAQKKVALDEWYSRLRQSYTVVITKTATEPALAVRSGGSR